MFQSVSTMLGYVNQWFAISLAQLFLLLSGVLLCVLTVAGVGERRLRLMGVIIGTAISSFFVLSAFCPYFFQVPTTWPGVSTGIILPVVAGLLLLFVLSKYKAYFFYPTVSVEQREGCGARSVVAFLIIMASLAVCTTGMLAPQPMVGDEVTHYYMLTRQAENLPVPNFFAHIPTGWGEEVRQYPHPFAWHYIGAVFYRISGNLFASVQLYQTIFFIQLLAAAYFLARRRSGANSCVPILYLLTLLSLPMVLVFSTLFYQGIPMTAQVVTAFALLDRRRWLAATLFLCFSLGFKVTAVIFIPVFLFIVFCRSRNWYGTRRAVWIFLCCCSLLGGSIFALERVLNTYGHVAYYPTLQVRKIIQRGSILQKQFFSSVVPATVDRVGENTGTQKTKKAAQQESWRLVNYPGNLRVPVNYLLYGGVVLWLICLIGLVQTLWQRCLAGNGNVLSTAPSSLWLFLVWGWYTVVTAVMMWATPDARFFLPGIPFLLLPMVEKAARLPFKKILVLVIAVLTIMQSGYVLAKIYRLRRVDPGLQATINYLQEDLPVPARIFMYPEGNYSLFPVPHEWYFDGHLREFWRVDNTDRIKMLHRYHIGAIVIKKYLVAPVDNQLSNLGVYPDFFIQQLKKDPRFSLVFENNVTLIFQVPFRRLQKGPSMHQQ